MQTLPDFIGEFLRAEQELRRRSVELERDMWARFALVGFCFSENVCDARSFGMGKLEDFQETEENVTATATLPCPSYDLTRARFVLIRMNGEWRISGLGYFCRLCAGTGKAVSPKSPETVRVCSICDGSGYFVPASLKAASAMPFAENPRSAKTDLDHFMHQFLVAERALIARQLELANEMWASFAVPHFRPPHLAALKRRWDDQTMVHTFYETASGAMVIATVVRAWHGEGRVRYTASRRDGAWWISGLEYACASCNGKGSCAVEKAGATTEMVCMVCHGKSWFPCDGPEAKAAGLS